MVEKKNGVVPVSKKVAASVLAGIMATGMVPAAAFAEGTATDTSSDSNVELQAEDDDVELQLKPDEAFSAGEVTLHKENGDAIDVSGIDLGTLPTDLLKENKDSYIEILIDKKTNTSLKLTYDEESGKLYDKTKFDKTKKKDLFYSLAYKNNSNITVNEDTVRNNAGKYKLVISATDGAYKGGSASVNFEIKVKPEKNIQ